MPRGEAVLAANSGIPPWWSGDGRAAGTWDNPLYLAGSEGREQMQGGAGDDRLYGLEGRDQLRGGAGNDALWAGGGDERVSGGTGNDELHGGKGRDVVRGGTGDDVFVFDSPDEGGDLISDFSNGGEWGVDRFALLAEAFGAAGPGALAAEAFQASTSDVALTADARIIYDTDDRCIYFDPDGAGGEDAYLLSVLLPWSVTPDATDFAFY